ncbi:hypothetical protein QS460_05095 [Liquorilactobacillus mali]|uniref:hypothetical protein n=1 Tax=Liquorilactobacillus mali TaxID=1618 RepID=UPI00264F0B47|nr:hypothetical protein [Liquorilactobacillus mali]MDN7145301.1 hypothetical protein [Liquorilactobacillus mali]
MRMNTGIEKSLKNIIKNVDGTRPILECAHFENGNIIATDSHQLIRWRDAAPKNLKMNLNLTNFSFEAEHVYPDISRLIPEKFGMQFGIPVRELLELIPLLKSVKNSEGSPTKMEVSNNVATFTSRLSTISDIEQKFSIKVENFEGEQIDINFNNQYLLNALLSIKDIKRFGNVQFKIVAPLIPFLIVYENMDYLITPVRVF